MIDAALRTVLLGKVPITSMLATYQFTRPGAGTPAIFAMDDFPEDAENPAILIEEMSSDRFGCRDSRGGRTNLDVYVRCDKSRSSADLDTLARLVWEALNRCDIASLLVGYEDWGVVADPPVRSPDSEEFPGRLIQVRATYLES
jgi:hypothetical protein